MQLKQTHVMYGFLTGLIMIVISAGIYASKMHITMPAIGWLIWVVYLIGLIMNAMAFSKANDTKITFGQAYGSCMKATLIITLIVTVWTAASHYVFPNMDVEMMDEARRRLQDKGLSEELIDKSMKYATMFTGPVFKVIGSIIGGAIAGAIFSLIAAAVAKKNPQPAQMM